MSSGRFIPMPVGNPNDVTTINDNFDSIATALNNVLSRYQDLPNAMNTTLDMNGYPIINQANPVTLTSFNWRGPWEPSTAYNEGDAVFYNSTSYLCQYSYTSTTNFMDDLLALYWTKIDLGTIYKGTWAPSTDYFEGDSVVYNNQFYISINDHTSGVTFNSANWQTYGAFGSMAAQNSNAINVTGGTMSGVTVPDPVSANQIANKEYVDNSAALSGVTGDLKLTFNSSQPAGWIPMNDGSIGNSGSGATYANSNALALFTLWWGLTPLWFPFTDGSGRGASATADWNANKAMMMPASIGRTLIGAGTATLNQTFTADNTTDLLTVATTSSLYTGTPVTVSNSGGALPAPLVAATTYYVVNVSGTTIKLASSQANANLGTVINLTNNGTGTNTITVNYQSYVLGEILGEPTHQLVAAELAGHIHQQSASSPGGGTPATDYNGTGTANHLTTQDYTLTNVGDTAHNNMQPSLAALVYVHL